mgnify:CR=1 FL=1
MSEAMDREFFVTQEYPLDKVETKVVFVDESGRTGLNPDDILELDDERLIIKNRKNLHFRIDEKDYTLPPKGRYGIIKEGWQEIVNIIRQFIPQNLKETFKNTINSHISDLLSASPDDALEINDGILVTKRASIETGLDLVRNRSIYERYVYSCMIRIVKRYAATLYSMCEKIWSTAEEFCLSSGYNWPEKSTERKANKFEGLSKSEIAAVKAKNKMLNPTSTEKKKRNLKEIKFRSLIAPVDTVKKVNAALINDKLPQREQKIVDATESTVPLYMIANFHSKLVAWNNSDAQGLRFTFPPFFVVDNESVWNLNTSKDLVLFKEVSLTALKSLKSPMILFNGRDPYSRACLEMTDGIDEIAEDSPILVKSTFKKLVGLIVKVINGAVQRDEDRQTSEVLLRDYKTKQANEKAALEAQQRQQAEAARIAAAEEAARQQQATAAEEQRLLADRVPTSDDENEDEWESTTTKRPKTRSHKSTKSAKASESKPSKNLRRRGMKN